MALDQYFTNGQPTPAAMTINWGTNPLLRKRAVDEAISFLDWREAAILKFIGVNNESKFDFSEWPARMYEWMYDESNPRRFNLGAALAAAPTTPTPPANTGGAPGIISATVTVPIDRVSFISRGDILIFEKGTANEEWAYVTGTPGTNGSLQANQVQVSRNFLAQQAMIDPQVRMFTEAGMQGGMQSGAGGFNPPNANSPYLFYGPKAHAAGTTVDIATTARGEGWRHDLRGNTQPKFQWNTRQILQTGQQITRSQELYKDYGIGDPYAYYLAKAIGGGQVGGLYTSGDLAFKLMHIHYNGIRFRSPNTIQMGDMAGGYEFFLRQHWVDRGQAAHYRDTVNMPNIKDFGNKPLTRKGVVDLFVNIFEQGGTPRTLVVNSWTMRKITSWFEGLVKSDRSETEGGIVIKTLVTEFGDMNLMYDRWMPAGRMDLMDESKLGICTQDPFKSKELPSDGDYRASELVGEYGYGLKEPNHHGMMVNFTQDF